MSSSVKAFYAVVDHTGTCLINQSITRLQMHSANLVIVKHLSRDRADRYDVIKDRWNTARDVYDLPGNDLTQEQADQIVTIHVAKALKYRRA